MCLPPACNRLACRMPCRWRGLQLASYVLDNVAPPIDLPTAADIAAKYAWWKWCIQEWVKGNPTRLRFSRPRMIYAELLMENLYRAAALPVQAVWGALAALDSRGLAGGAVSQLSPAVFKRLQSVDGYRSLVPGSMATQARLASVLTLACIMVGQLARVACPCRNQCRCAAAWAPVPAAPWPQCRGRLAAPLTLGVHRLAQAACASVDSQQLKALSDRLDKLRLKPSPAAVSPREGRHSEQTD